MIKDKVIIQTLPPRVIGNIIIVGDIHGCLDEFNALLDKVEFRPGIDLFIHVGDLVNKGKNSKGVVDRCIEIGAIGVVGNHDDTLLECIAEKAKYKEEDYKDPVKRTAKYFGFRQTEYLRNLPHILKIPQYNLIIVHAGINPYLGLEEQNPMDLTNMRRVMADGKAVAKGSYDGTPWAKVWSGPETIIFGHDAKAGLQQEQFALGLDTGCVYGDKLTAVVYPGGKLVTVPGVPRKPREKPTSDGAALATPLVNAMSPDFSTRLVTPSMIRAGSERGMTTPSATPTMVSTPGGGITPNANAWPSQPPGVRSSPTPSKPDDALAAAKRQTIASQEYALRILIEAKQVDLLLALMATPPFEQEWDNLREDPSIPLKVWKDFVWLLANNISDSPKERQESLLGYIQDVLFDREDVKNEVCFILKTKLQSDKVNGRIDCEMAFRSLMLTLKS